MISSPIDPAMSFGIRNELGSFDRACWLFYQANRLGLDAMTLSTLIGFATDLFQRGIITKEDTEGLVLKPGFQTTEKLLEMTAAKEGFGAILAEGFEGLTKRFGHKEEAYQIKGTEPDFDARACMGVEVFGSVVNPRGAHDMPVGGLTVAKGRKPEFFRKVVSKVGYVPEEAMDRIFSEHRFDLGRLTAHYENWATILNCLGVCFRMQNSSLYDVRVAAEVFSAATGIEKDYQELLKDAERAYNVYKMLNVREGFGRKDDRFPKKWFEPLKRPDKGQEMVLTDYFGHKRLTREDIERILDSYYEEKGWDVKKGIPTREKLMELDLEDIANSGT
jgi:aldehyde:ferredoxin oxidoreductase